MNDGKSFNASAEDFKKIPGSPIAYWVGEKMIKAFENKPIREFGFAGIGMRTGDNKRFLRMWYEVALSKVLFGCGGKEEQIDSGRRWIPYNKGGEYRKWYGNNDYLVDWFNDGFAIKTATLESYPQLDWDHLGWKISNEAYYYLPGITWSGVTSGDFACRCYGVGFIFDSGANGFFPAKEEDIPYFAALLNSCFANTVLKIINPTINTGCGTLSTVPVVVNENIKSTVEEKTITLISLSRADWDEYETSWDFKVNPLVREGWQRNGAAMNIETAWAAVFARRMEWAERMKTLEEENNRQFIEAYGLQDELSPDVEWKNVSITGNPAYRYKLDGDPQSGEGLARADAMRELISYGMGVLMGRYSLEQEGLILASQGELYKDYIARVHGAGKILPDEDGVIPAITLEGGFFKDNLLHRIREFLSAAFGNDALPQNLNFIEAALGCGFDKYLTDKFFDDHVKTYKKRPIYWLFESPKGYFRAFAYMHRMTGATAGHIRNNYLQPYIGHLEKCFAAEVAKGSSMTSAERKRVKAMEAAIKDCKAYDLVLHDFADRAVAIDLDDGVVVNWKKYESVLAKL